MQINDSDTTRGSDIISSQNQTDDLKLPKSLASQEHAQDIDEALYDDEFFGGSVDRQNPERSLLLAKTVAVTAAEHGGENIVVLDMTERTALFDYFVIVTGSSRRQLHAISEEIDQTLKVKLNDKRLNIDGLDDSRWIVLDYGTVVVHLFDEDTRMFYSLETLWSDTPRVDLADELRAINPNAVK